MSRVFKTFAPALLSAVCLAQTAHAAVETIAISRPPPAPSVMFKMGNPGNPKGQTLTVGPECLFLDGRPWMPVMGEFHYARYPTNEWREELLKMKAGGINTVSTYVFWIHHEEVEGKWDWSGNRDLRAFVQQCQDVGLKVLVRCGPWDHGEVRNGGSPDWLLQKGWRLRSTDTNYLAQVRVLYGQIAAQLDGLLWKDGGPVIGIQLDNEYSGSADYLLALKRIARDAGLDVPLYTKTGWPALKTPLPLGEIIPFYGVYAEGFWDRVLTPMPGDYWRGFYFSRLRTDAAIGTDILGQRVAKDPPDVDDYPYLTCEIGAGMETSYHRRILFYPEDALATALIKLGDGGMSLGYYMYHGGENPDGALSTLMESQATGMWNDMPVKNYDFQTALGEYGQIRPQYDLLRRLHLFLDEWGPQLANMPATMPDHRPAGRDDVSTLRWDVRSDGVSGFVFVNNYQRLQEMPPKTNVQFAINLPSGPLVFPSQPMTIPSGACFLWPFNFDLGRGVKVDWATAQPVSAIDDAGTRTVFFAQTGNIPVEFVFNKYFKVEVFSGKTVDTKDQVIISRVRPGTRVAMLIQTPYGPLQIVLLSDEQSLAFWKLNWQGSDRVFLTDAGLVIDGNNLRLTSTNRAALNLAVYPDPLSIPLHGKANGVFTYFEFPKPAGESFHVGLEQIQLAGPPREIPMGKIRQPVAAAPLDDDFKQAAVWRIKLPANLDLSTDPLLRLHYVGDVARVTLNGKLLIDNFYNGTVFEVGLRRYAPEILTGDLRVEILPLRKDAPIMLPKEAVPDFGGKQSIVSLDSVELIPRYHEEFREYSLRP
jgi:beta-galactosidase